MIENKNYLPEVVYPDSVKKYSTNRIPQRESQICKHLAYLVSSFFLCFLRKGYKVERINMKGLKPPYILLINHLQPVDFCMMFKVSYPHRINTVAAYNTYYGVSFFMEKLGCIPTRKFTTDMNLVRCCKKVLHEYGDVFCMFPEARYTPDGTLSVLPDSLGKLAKKNNVPVVIMMNYGGYLNRPFWANTTHRKTPIKVAIKQVLTAEQVGKMTADEINEVIHNEMYYDEFRWQKENNIHITEDYRAEGLHKILYQCPHCMAESQMNSQGVHLFCENCGKKWEMTELGELKALEGETEFSHIPDWFAWERQNVHREILDGKYIFQDRVHIHSTPGVDRFIDLGEGTVTHTLKDGFVIEFSYNGNDYRIVRSPKNMYSVQIEYNFEPVGSKDCFNVTTNNDCFFCSPEKKDVIAKVMLATEEIYKILNDK